MLTKLIKLDEYNLRNAVYQSRGEPGVLNVLQVLEQKKATALMEFKKANGLEELVRAQAVYNTAQSVIDLITKEPTQFLQKKD